jgi:hypothetical protein
MTYHPPTTQARREQMHEPPNATREKREEANLNVKGGDEKFADTAGWRRPAHFPRPLLAYHAGRFPKRVAASIFAHLF